MRIEPAAKPWAVMAVTSLAIFSVYLDTTILFVAFPSIAATFPTVSAADLSWTLNAYTIVFGALLVPSGQLADRVGRRRVFGAGILVFTLGSALGGLAPSVTLLVAARVVQAIGAAILIPSSLALILAAFPRERRAVAVSLWGAVGALSSSVGPSVGAAIVQHAGWRWAFYINLPIGVAAWVWSRRVLVESRDARAAGGIDALGTLLLVAGLGLLALGIVDGPTWGWLSARTGGAIALGLLGLAGVLVRSAQVRWPVIDLSLFRDRNYRLANLGTLVFSMAFSAMFLGFVLFLTTVWRYPIQTAGLAITPGPLMVIPVAIAAGRRAARHGHRTLLVAGGLLYALGGFLLMHLPPSPSFGIWLPAALVTGVGVGLVLPSLSAAAVHGLTPTQFGVGSGVNQAVRQIGSVLGVAIAIALLTAAPGPTGLSHVFAMLVVAGLLVAAIGTGVRTAPRA